MSSISSNHLDNNVSAFEYFTKRAEDRAAEQKATDKQVYGQQKAMEFTTEDMPVWAQAQGIEKDSIIRAAPVDIPKEESNLSKSEQFNNAVLAEMKANGNDITAAVSTVKSEMFEEIFLAKLEELKGDAVGALAYARQQIPGGLDNAELKNVLLEMTDLEYPLSDGAKEVLANALHDLEAQIANTTTFEDLLEGNASAALTSESYLTETQTSDPSEADGAAQAANKNIPTTISESYRMEAFAFTKSQFPNDVNLENNEEAKALFEQRLG